jgi:2-alkyl-3-oxoalkanoate reductase
MISSRKVAVIGANGFVGSRLVELFHLAGMAEVVPVVRSVNSLARLSRFDLDWRLADSRDADTLALALRGCDQVVDAMVGDPRAIQAAAAALLPAAHRAGVRRVVYLSSASVHGQNPAPGTDETTPLDDRQDVAYNNAKVRAERRLLHDARRLGVELVVLRPSIVYGPRDRWVTSLVGELLQGTAWLVGEGAGICNGIYVDNLAHAVRLALSAPVSAVGRAYLLNDRETITWGLLEERTRALLGQPVTPAHRVPAPEFPPAGWASRLDDLRAAPAAQALLARVPAPLKSLAKAATQALRHAPRPAPWTLRPAPGPRFTVERVRLQQCAWRFPCDAARAGLAYEPPVAFGTGLERTIAWLRWCGQLPEIAP